MKKGAVLLLLLVCIVFLSGCFNITIEEKLKRNGDSDLKIVYDMSAVANMMAQMGNASAEDMAEFENNLSQMCTDFKADTTLENVECETTADYRVIITGVKTNRDKSEFQVRRGVPYITYVYDTKGVYSTLSDVGESGGQDFSEESLAQTKAMAGAMGLKMEYVLEMRGKIVDSDVGEINGNKITIDMFDLIGEDGVYVKSQELNVLWDLIVLIIIIVIVVVLIMVLKKKGGSRQPEAPAPGQPPEQLPKPELQRAQQQQVPPPPEQSQAPEEPPSDFGPARKQELPASEEQPEGPEESPDEPPEYTG